MYFHPRQFWIVKKKASKPDLGLDAGSPTNYAILGKPVFLSATWDAPNDHQYFLHR